MAQFYSLQEAARVLGMSPDELKQKAQQREVRAFQDRGDWQFRTADIDELARRRGMGSDPDLSLSDLDLDISQAPGSGSEDINLSEFQLGVARSDTDQASQEVSNPEGDVEIDEAALPPDLTGSSSTIIGMKPMGKEPSDSDVKLVPDDAVTPGGLSASDSDVRLSGPMNVAPSDSDVTLVADESAEMPAVRSKPGGSQAKKKPTPTPAAEEDDPGATTLRPSPDMGDLEDDPGATTLRPSPEFGSSAEIEATGGEGDSDSDFELTPSSVIDALQPDSGSDFELTALDASDEFDSPTPKRGPSDSDVTGVEPSASGVNLGRPSDSGINLVTGGFDMNSADSIELAPLDDEDETPKPKPKPAPAKPAPKPKAELSPESDPSATALPMKSPVEKDIFDDTDFEVDALDSGEATEDRTMQLEATSDFDIDEGDSASEVFAIDEEDVDQNAATAMAAAPDLDDAFGEGAEEGISGEMEADDAWGDVAEDSPSATARRRLRRSGSRQRRDGRAPGRHPADQPARPRMGRALGRNARSRHPVHAAPGLRRPGSRPEPLRVPRRYLRRIRPGQEHRRPDGPLVSR